MKLNRIENFAETRDAAAFATAISVRVEAGQAFVQSPAPQQSAPSYMASAAA